MNEIQIYSDIGPDFWGDGVTAAWFAAQLETMSGDVTVAINSYGGDVFEGHAIHSLMRQYDRGQVHARIDGIAASAASVVAVAGDTIEMPDTALMMIHDPWTMTVGDAGDMRKTAETLDKIKEAIVASYRRVSSLSDGELSAMMSAETWLSAEEAVAAGLATTITGAGNQPALNATRRWIKSAPKPADEAYRVAARQRRLALKI